MISQENKNTTVAENGSVGVGHSDSVAKSGTGVKASSTELAKALAESRQIINTLQLEIATLKNNNSNNSGADINKLAEAIAGAIKSVGPQGPQETDNINRTTDFTNSRMAVDGRSLMEAQQTLQHFRREKTKPLSIPKFFQNQVGPNLTVTVNGVRVSIPCDGKTYMINETHWEHAKERIAKLDAINTSSVEAGIVEVN